VSQSILKSIAQKRKAEWFNESTPQTASDASRAALASWVAAPILAPDGTVRGALYGDRVRDEDSPSHLVTEVDGLLVEMLASGVATGLARQDELSRISGARAQFARFFGAQLAGELDRNPTLLESRRADVTLLFADVRRFSAISEKKPEHVIDWLRDVMNLMTSKIQGRGGVLLDFVGDEAIAIWNAPRAQDDHCALAVAAALDILEAMPDLNARWFERLGTRTEVGIGVNHGPAMVGNIGSDDRLKYGALGRNVNLASRLQGLTKYLKVKLLISQSVRDQLLGNDRFIIRRVCKTRVVNMDEPVDVYEVDRLDAPGSERRAQLFKASETALALFEGKDWAAAAEQASEKLRDFRKDGPLLLTLSRAVEMLRDETRDFDPAWEPPGK
jgi:adenylate cyclase